MDMIYGPGEKFSLCRRAATWTCTKGQFALSTIAWANAVGNVDYGHSFRKAQAYEEMNERLREEYKR